MARSKSSRQWLAEHFTDEFVKRAQKEGYRSRAVYKLKEIDERDRLLKPGTVVVDLGAAPGAWSQYARTRVGARGVVVASDILAMSPVPGVTFVQGDFTETATVEALHRALSGRPVDLVIADMAPNISGVAVADQARTMYLSELALAFAAEVLRPGGDCLIKTFQGSGFNALFGEMKRLFAHTATRKPAASRARSAEIYLLGKGRKGN